jgi:hypothetical protein
MDLLSLLLAAAMAVGTAGASTGTPPSDGTDARSHIIEIGADSTATPAPSPTPGDGDDARSHIIEIG